MSYSPHSLRGRDDWWTGREPPRTGNPPVTLDRPQAPSGIARCQRGIELERTCPLVTGARSSDGPLLGSGGNRGACRASVLGDADVRGNLPRRVRSRSSPSRPSTSKAPANSVSPPFDAAPEHGVFRHQEVFSACRNVRPMACAIIHRHLGRPRRCPRPATSLVRICSRFTHGARPRRTPVGCPPSQLSTCDSDTPLL